MHHADRRQRRHSVASLCAPDHRRLFGVVDPARRPATGVADRHTARGSKQTALAQSSQPRENTRGGCALSDVVAPNGFVRLPRCTFMRQLRSTGQDGRRREQSLGPSLVRWSAMATVEEITRHDDADPDEDVWVGAPPAATPIDIVDADPSWPAQFDELADRIRRALGNRVLDLEHIGSTSVPYLPAKPIVDIDLTVADSSDESMYVPPLERAGFVLAIREPSWHQHRCLVATTPRANLHVWSPDSPEAIRHRMFRDWLRDHPEDRRRYAQAKRSAAGASNAADETVMAYNLRKQPVVREILDRMFRAHGML
jgi:GrpB-like predicted nucleotidyltransferase (UPF0157 family)